MRILGLMTGTSVDALDAAWVEIDGSPPDWSIRCIGFKMVPFPQGLRERLLGLASAGRAPSPAERVDAGGALASFAVSALREEHDRFGPVDLVASHGQTVYHRSRAGTAPAVTVQIDDAAYLCKGFGAPVVYDFRVADVEAGGHGAPLAPLFHFALFRGHGVDAVLNVGGIANVTVLRSNRTEDIVAFDTGPGMMVADAVYRHFFGDGGAAIDGDGALAATGRVNPELLRHWLDHPYFRLKPPKSTGRETFGAEFAQTGFSLARELSLSPQDTLATAVALTAQSVADALQTTAGKARRIAVCGGGARNATLLRDLNRRCDAEVVRSDVLGYPADAVEAIGFALLGYESFHGRPGNVPSATGAIRPVVLGRVYR